MKRVRSIEHFLKKMKISNSGNPEIDNNIKKIQNTRRAFFEKISQECKTNVILRDWTTFGLFNDIDKHLKHHKENEIINDINLIVNSFCIRNSSSYVDSVRMNDVLIFHYNEIKNEIDLENLTISN